MALKTNSKQVREAVKNYIVESFHNSDFEDWHEVSVTDYKQICSIVLSCFYVEKMQFDNRYKAGRISKYDLFKDWCAGLPSIIGCEYYYNVSAVDMLGDWLQETEEEKARFSEQDAEEMVTRLIFQELCRQADFLPTVKKSDADRLGKDYKFKTAKGVTKGFFSGLIGEAPSTVLLTEGVHFVIVRD